MNHDVDLLFFLVKEMVEHRFPNISIEDHPVDGYKLITHLIKTQPKVMRPEHHLKIRLLADPNMVFNEKTMRFTIANSGVVGILLDTVS